VSERAGNREIYTMSADGSDQTRLTHNEALDSHPTWSPDGTQIAFVSERDGRGDIYIIRVDGFHLTRLTRNKAVYRPPVWRP
jgi:Tol biopolymer transport system component